MLLDGQSGPGPRTAPGPAPLPVKPDRKDDEILDGLRRRE